MIEIKTEITQPELPSMVRYRQLCLECCIAALGEYYGTAYSVPLCEYADTTYRADGAEAFSERLKADKDIAEQYGRYGVRLEKKLAPDMPAYSEYIESEINARRPVITHLDCYYVPWDRLCGQYHNKHTVVTTGVKPGAYYVSDPYFGESGRIEKDLFHKGSGYYFDIDTDAFVRMREIGHRNALVNKLERMYKEGYFVGLTELGGDIPTAAREPDAPDTLLKYFERVELNKQRFMLFLFEWERLEGHRRYTEEYGRVWTRWQVLKALSHKAKCRKYDSHALAEIAEYLSRTVTYEETAMLGLTEARQGIKSARAETDLTDIERYCNNKGLTLTPENADADCTGLGEFVCVGEKMTEIEKRGYKLLYDRAADNISCRGQTLCCECKRNIDRITFLAAAEWGDHELDLKLVYTDGTEVTKRKSIRDWINGGENRICIGSGYLMEDGRLRKLHENIYAEEIAVTLDKTETLEKIILPECGNIHIFAIKLEKGDRGND